MSTLETAPTKKQIVFSELTEFANELKAAGFNVLVSAKHPFEWLHFEKDGKFGTVSPNGFFSYNFSTVHKPCKECGTGYGMERDTNLTVKYAANCLIFAPNWAASKDMAAIKKYSSIEDFINSTHNKWAEYYTL